MDCNVLLNFLLCVILHNEFISGEHGDLKKYLVERSIYVRNEIKVIAQAEPKEKRFDIVYNTTKRINLPGLDAKVETISLFGNLYLIAGVELYDVFYDGNQFVFNFHSSLSVFDEKITFIKSCEYEDVGFLLMTSSSGYMNVFGFDKDFKQFVFIQSISYEGMVSDAKFFTNQKSLYLIVAKKKNSDFVHSTIYKWTGAHFDKVDETLMRGAVRVATFSSGLSEIVVILQNPQSERIRSTVFEFSNEKLRKIQHLKATDPKEIVTYELNRETYVAIFDSNEKSVLYWWDGAELVKWNFIGDIKGSSLISFAHIHGYPFIFTVKKNTIEIYSQIVNDIDVISEIQLSQHFQNKNVIKYVHHEGKHFLFVFGTEFDFNTIIDVIEFSVNINEIGNYGDEKDRLLQCFTNLEQKLYANRRENEIIKKNTLNILQANEPLEFKGRMNVAAPVFTDSAKINSKFITKKYAEEMSEINSKIKFLKNCTQTYKNHFGDDNNEKMTIKKNIIIKGSLQGNRLTARNIKVEYLNKKKWSTSDLLSYTKPQTIKTKAFFENLVVNDVNVINDDDLFKNLLLRAGNQLIDGFHQFNTFTVTKLFAQTINNIPFNNIYLRSSDLLITGIKRVNKMNVDSLLISQINEKKPSDVIGLFVDSKNLNYTFGSKVLIDNFNFELMNGINWVEFRKSVFQTGKTIEIGGSVTMSKFKSNQLNAKSINGVPTEYLLTTCTAQTINSSMTFTNINVANIAAKTLNGIGFKDIAFPGEVIKGHVRVDNVHVTGDLHIHGGDNPKSDQHIVGTNESDLLQIYNKKVKITGNLNLQNVFFTNTTALYVNGYRFYLDDLKNYWLKNTNQLIPVHFEAQNGLTAVHLLTDSLNGVAIGDYMLNNYDEKQPTKYHFENITVAGNVVVDKKLNHLPDLQKIHDTSVRLKGTFVIKGEKRFQNTLKIGNLKVDYLDNKDAFGVLTKQNKAKVVGTKYFESLIVRENLFSDSINTHILNNFELRTLMHNSLYVDRPVVIEKANFNQLKVENLHAIKLNDENFENYFRSFDDSFNLDTLNKVEIIGDVQIDSVQNLLAINEIETKSILENSVNRKKYFTIQGNVTFRGNANIGALKAFFINDIDFGILYKRLLYKNNPQDIESKHFFNSIESSNLYASVINKIQVDQMVDTKANTVQNLVLKKGMRLKGATFNQPVESNLICDLYEAYQKVQNNPVRALKKLTVLKDAEILDKNSPLGNLFKNVITKDNRNNVVTGPMFFKNHILANNVYFLKQVDDVNITNIYHDALLMYSDKLQVVSGLNTFDYLKLEDTTIMADLDVPKINEINISALNNSIIYKNRINEIVIKGRKTFFDGLHTKNLHGQPFDTENLVSLTNLKPIPSVLFDDVVVEENLNVNYVNHMNFLDILNKRLKLNSEIEQESFGIYYFDTMILDKNSNTTTNHINNIRLDDVVFDEGVQEIAGRKTFMKNLEIYGNVEINTMNNHNIINAYENTILLDENAEIKGDVVFERDTEMLGNLNASSLNGIPIERLEKMVEMEVTEINTKVDESMLNEIAEEVRKSFVVIKRMPNKYMYLEKAEELQVAIPKAMNAQAVQGKGGVMIHITSEESGSYCGLPEDCYCPAQHTLHITPQFSINSFMNKGSQRIYSYDDEHITIHFVTNTVSVNSKCRSSLEMVKNETSSLTWNTASTNNKTGGFYLFPEYFSGYISGVEFFKLNGCTYAIVGRYYDALQDTHDLGYQVIKFSEEMDKAEIIQTIPAKGAWTLHVFGTAQGVTLIVGNLIDNIVQIYVFVGNEFKLLRNIFRFGCTSATGVALGDDSWIILAEKRATLQIFKYTPKYDNYYFYQNLKLDSEVLGISSFYNTGFDDTFGTRDAYLSVATNDGVFYIYTFHSIEGWTLQFNGEINNLQRLIPFTLNAQPYLFAPSSDFSSLLAFTKQGFN